MTINIVSIIVIIIIAGLCYWVNETANMVPVLKTVVKVLIVIIAVLLLLQSMGLIGGSTSIHVN